MKGLPVTVKGRVTLQAGTVSSQRIAIGKAAVAGGNNRVRIAVCDGGAGGGYIQNHFVCDGVGAIQIGNVIVRARITAGANDGVFTDRSGSTSYRTGRNGEESIGGDEARKQKVKTRGRVAKMDGFVVGCDSQDGRCNVAERGHERNIVVQVRRWHH